MKNATPSYLQTKIYRVFLLFFCFYGSTSLTAQTVVNENFDTYNNALPLGWNWYNLTGSSENSNKWLDRNNTLPVLPNPTPVAFSGSNYLFYNVMGSVTGEQAYLVTKSFDLSARGASPANIRFYMYRDNVVNNYDSITVYAGNSTSLTSATRLAVYPRYYNWAPTGAANNWNLVTLALPAAINTSHTYIFFVGTSRIGRDILIDNFSIDTWPSAMSYLSTTLWHQGIQTVSKGAINEAVVGIQVVTNNAGTPLNLYRITFNANGSSNPVADIQNAKLWYTGQTNAFSTRAPTSNQVGVTITPVIAGTKIAFMNPVGLQTLTNDTNYFWLTYDVKATATSNNLLDAEFDSVVVGTTFAGALYSAPAVATLPGNVLIDPYCIPSSSAACVACYVQGVYLAGANGSKISTGSSVLALPSNTGAMNNGTLYCFWPCISPPLGTVLRYRLFPPITNQTTTLNAGLPYTLKIQYGQITGNVGAWIDYNNDGDFNDTLFNGPTQYYERLGFKASTGTTIAGCTGGGCTVVGGNTNSQNLLINFTVPPAGTPGLVYGNHRLRVREVSLFTGTITPCTSYSHGETEDYTVTVAPACVAGLCQWLGYTDDWNVPANWCPNIPTINDIARVDFSYSFTSAAVYKRPKIKSGVAATCKILRIANTDTVYISSPRYDETTGTGIVSAATLTIADSMSINYNTVSGNGAFKVISTKSDSLQASNGTSGFSISPFLKNRVNSRMQLIFTQNELKTKGLIEGDVIDSLVFYLRAVSGATNDSFKVFNIQVANLLISGWGWPAGLPTQWAPTGPFTTIFGPTTLDVRNPQPGLHPNAVPSVTAANKGQLSLVTIPNSFVWDGISDIVLDICFSNRPAFGLPPTFITLSQTQTTGLRSVCGVNNASNTLTDVLCGVNFPFPAGNAYVVSDYRPNITFKFRRPFNKPLITMSGDVGAPGGFWVNNGNFIAGRSEVKFTGTLNDQEIKGSNNTTFADLTIDQNTSKVIMQKDVFVDSVLTLSTGELTLNRNLLGINNNQVSAVVRTAGWVRSEDQPPGNYSRISRNIGSGPGLFIYPFGVDALTYLPFTYSPSGDAGIVTLASYRTSANNTPYPVIGGPFGIGVNHMNGQATGADISVTDVVDRFWQINKTGPSNNATLTFRYKPSSAPAGEEPASTPFTYTAQRFQVPGGTGAILGGWANFPGANTPGSLTAILSNDTINGPWTLGNFSNPLPVELISFDALLIGDKVKTYWATASEENNDYFIVERTTNLNDYDFIAKVASSGNSSAVRNYEAFDYEPLFGLQYYRLKTVSLDGNEEISKPIPIKINRDSEFVINFISSNSENRTMLVSMHYNSVLPYSVKLMNVFGQIVFYKENYKGINGTQVIDLNNILQTKGVYFIELENNQEKISKKFIY